MTSQNHASEINTFSNFKANGINVKSGEKSIEFEELWEGNSRCISKNGDNSLQKDFRNFNMNKEKNPRLKYTRVPDDSTEEKIQININKIKMDLHTDTHKVPTNI